MKNNIRIGDLYQVRYPNVHVWSLNAEAFKHDAIELDKLNSGDIVMCIDNTYIDGVKYAHMNNKYFKCLTHNGIIGDIYIDNVMPLT